MNLTTEDIRTAAGEAGFTAAAFDQWAKEFAADVITTAATPISLSLQATLLSTAAILAEPRTETTAAAQDPRVEKFLSLFAHADVAEQLATKLSCAELDALVDLFRMDGDHRTAGVWLNFHALGDEEDDEHLRAELEQLCLDFSGPEPEARDLHRDHPGVVLFDQDPDAFGLAHQVLYINGDDSQAFAITDIYSEEHSDSVIAWEWDAYRRGADGAMIAEHSGRVPSEQWRDLSDIAYRWVSSKGANA